MVVASVRVLNPAGLHARLASLLCARAKAFQANIVIRASGYYISARNILDMMAANVRCGEVIVIHCDGQDEANALLALCEFIANLSE
ncbi:MAG: HPr family phosphocarrier protein [Eubacteriales bacterium]|nr:HPr family phosphocarrier protein [Eubacteriales bacterium]